MYESLAIAPYSCGMAALACTALAMLMEVLEITSVWKKLTMLLRKGSDCAATLPDLSLNACIRGQATLQGTPLSTRTRQDAPTASTLVHMQLECLHNCT